MQRRIIWLRISYWAAALGDWVIAILVLFPSINGENHYSIPMGMMSSAAFSWGVMMVFADRKPIERRWMLIPTMLVIVLLGIVSVLGGIQGLISTSEGVLRAMLSLVLFVITLYSYCISKEIN